MSSLEQIKQLLSQQRPSKWEQLPDLELYMDQVLTYMQRQYVASRKEDQLTSSMINNYIKEGLLARANGKKYSKEHLAHLTAISMMKQVLSVKDTGFLVKQSAGDLPPEDFYTLFLSILDGQMLAALGVIPQDDDERLLTEAALRLAVESYVSRLACERLLDLLRPGNEKEKEKEKDKEKSRQKEKKASKDE